MNKVSFGDYYDTKRQYWTTKIQFRYIYVFDDFEGKNYICITKDDSVYGFGSNSSGCLGFNHNECIPEPTLIPDLCSKSICALYRGQSHMIARNDRHEIFCWGHNTCGQLGIGIHKQFMLYSAKINESLSQKSIVEISCGSNHSLGLTTAGEVYAWGDNDHGQIGCGSSNRFHSKPVKLSFFQGKNIKSICCGSNHSVVMTSQGQIFAWGDNGYGQLGIGTEEDPVNSPREVDLSSLAHTQVIRIVCSKFSTFFLTMDKTIYFYGTTDHEDSADLNKLSQNTKINDMNTVHHCFKGYIFTAKTDNMIYEIVESWKEFEKHKYTDCVEFYAKKYKITHKLIDFEYKPKILFRNTQSLGTILKTRSFENVLKADSLTNKQNKPSFETFESRFRNIHEIKDEVAKGTFGTVYKVKHVLDNQFYAVKKIMTYDITDERALLEDLRKFTKLDHSHVTNYYSVWMENEECIYIQMEFCETNLRNVIAANKPLFKSLDSNPLMQTIEYYICCEILKEILKGLRCLHHSEPPVIHGNLNLHNILISFSNVGKSSVKLGGYGLAKYKYAYEISMVDKEYAKHIAPEVLLEECIHTHSDIYSLGFVCRQLFGDSLNLIHPSPFENKMQAMHNLIDSMLLYPDWNERPSCRDILSRIQEWSVSWEQIVKISQISDLRKIFINFTESPFLYKFLSVKTGKGFDKIILVENKIETPTQVKNQICSIYRSNSVSRHWMKDSGTAAEPKTDNIQAHPKPLELDEHEERAPSNKD